MTASHAEWPLFQSEVLFIPATFCYKFQSDSDPARAARSGMGCRQRMRRASRTASARMKCLWSVCLWGVIGILLRLVPSALAAAPYGLETRAPIGAFLNNHLPPASTERS